ncbi:hypothetical protein [Flammeovirga aprica]|uniref:Uncharacterized protein n=1 Tax=Flammeovirga aprica JL-4 TaxID=694437 RepID=A0A7X9S1W1_9BACT|nr:hypothetical protein [Flammeovirga aprica]NME72756.1 hypothetical protein [Flammeovirga aprica JL-4]
MKNKLRRLVVDSKVFFYVINETYSKVGETADGEWRTVLRLFREGYKNTALEFHFNTQDVTLIGNPLTNSSEFDNKNKEQSLNLHKPSIVKIFIRYGLKNGWDFRKSKMKFIDGNDLIRNELFK